MDIGRGRAGNGRVVHGKGFNSKTVANGRGWQQPMNAPDRYELFVLPEGVKKLSITPDTKIPNCCSFTVEKEDHTLGNLLCKHVQKHEKVVFAGYRMPHPIEHKFVLKVQTEKPTKPTEALESTVDQLISDLAILEDHIRDNIRRFQSTARTY